MNPPRSIRFWHPTSRALGRMSTILFRPFDIGKWFALGFSAWLAMLGQNGGSSNISSNNTGSFPGTSGMEEGGAEESFQEVIQPAIDFFNEHRETIFAVGIILVVFIVVLSVLFIWLSSRGKFMFLDNVIHNRSLVKAPWRDFKVQGNSLFVWRLVFNLITLVIMGGLFVVAFLFFAKEIGFDIRADSIEAMVPGEVEWNPEWLMPIIGFIGSVLLVASIVGYIGLMLESFVVPLMYKHQLSSTAAWGRFFTVHRDHFGKFFLFALWSILICIPIMMAVFAFVILTCCLGGLFLAIPYIGAVIMLPITVFVRSLSIEFFRQFGDKYDVWEGLLEDGFFPEVPPLPPHS